MNIKTKVAQAIVRPPTAGSDQVRSNSRSTDRHKRVVSIEASVEYLEWRIPQMRSLDEAVAAVDRGEFASDAEVLAVFGRYGLAAAPLTAEPPL